MLASRPAGPLHRLHPGPGRPLRARSCAAIPRPSSSAWTSTRQAIRIAQERLEPFGDRVTLYHLATTGIYPKSRSTSSASGASSSTWACPPSSWTPRSGVSATRSTARSTCAWTCADKTSAASILEKASEIKLAQIFRDYGELQQARKLARAIASARRLKPLESTTELRVLVEQVCHWIPQKGKIHPASKVFQALRIEVNNELDEPGRLPRVDPAAPAARRPPGRHLLPFAGGPHRQAHLPEAGRRRGRHAPDRYPDPQAGHPLRRRGRPQPALAGRPSCGRRRGDDGPQAPPARARSRSGSRLALLVVSVLFFYLWHINEKHRLGLRSTGPRDRAQGPAAKRSAGWKPARPPCWPWTGSTGSPVASSGWPSRARTRSSSRSAEPWPPTSSRTIYRKKARRRIRVAAFFCALWLLAHRRPPRPAPGLRPRPGRRAGHRPEPADDRDPGPARHDLRPQRPHPGPPACPPGRSTIGPTIAGVLWPPASSPSAACGTSWDLSDEDLAAHPRPAGGRRPPTSGSSARPIRTWPPRSARTRLGIGYQEDTKRFYPLGAPGRPRPRRRQGRRRRARPGSSPSSTPS